MDWLERERLLIGEAGIEKLRESSVAVAGLGGVGGAAAEALCRAGVGRLIIADCDAVEATNLNRQLIATADTVGMRKTEASAKRLLSINPSLGLVKLDMRVSAENIDVLLSEKPDFVIDAVDEVTAKLLLISRCREKGIPIISSMGTGNRLDPSGFRIGTIESTSGCGCALARVMRRELRKRRIENVPVVYSVSPALEREDNDKRTVGSISFVPPAAGFLLASYAVRRLLEDVVEKEKND